VASTKDYSYTDSLKTKSSVWWKSLLNVQYPYKKHLQYLKPGFVLDIGCGIGRNLLHLNGHGVGIDHNEHSVATALSKGLKAFTPNIFLNSTYNKPALFDSILFAHIFEHLNKKDACELLQTYLPLLKKEGKIIIITPQEKGFKSDCTHVQFADYAYIEQILLEQQIPIYKKYSFPFPRFAGRFFTYNEFVVIAKK